MSWKERSSENTLSFSRASLPS